MGLLFFVLMNNPNPPPGDFTSKDPKESLDDFARDWVPGMFRETNVGKGLNNNTYDFKHEIKE